MKRIIIISVLVFMGVAGTILMMQKNADKDNVQVSSASFAAVQKDLEDKSKLYDVRTAEEYDEARLYVMKVAKETGIPLA